MPILLGGISLLRYRILIEVLIGARGKILLLFYRRSSKQLFDSIF